MSDDTLSALVLCYVVGSSITLMAMDPPRHERFLFRRMAMWPLYWAYVLLKMGFMLRHELRR